MEELISIIIPVYNIKGYVSKCLQSVSNQTYHNLEFIVIDDGSTDGSEKICDEFGKKDNRFKVYHTKNSGLSAARNFGIEKANGHFITFVDGDDYIEKDYTQYLYHLLKKYRADMSICSFKVKTAKSEKKFAKKNSKESVYSTKLCLEKMLAEDGFNVSACGKLFPKELFKNAKFIIGKIHEDVGTVYKLILECEHIAFGPKPNYVYCQRGGSIIHSFSRKKLDLIVLTDQMCDEIDQVFPSLQDVTNVRRMRARFSILRQLPKSENKIAKEMLEYLKSHKNFIIGNQKASKKDKIAMYSVSLGKSFFQFSWKIYEKLFK